MQFQPFFVNFPFGLQEKMINHYEVHGFGNYLMTRKSDGQKVGCISLYNREDVDGVDIGQIASDSVSNP